jgi:hypothetical protein
MSMSKKTMTVTNCLSTRHILEKTNNFAQKYRFIVSIRGNVSLSDSSIDRNKIVMKDTNGSPMEGEGRMPQVATKASGGGIALPPTTSLEAIP